MRDDRKVILRSRRLDGLRARACAIRDMSTLSRRLSPFLTYPSSINSRSAARTGVMLTS